MFHGPRLECSAYQSNVIAVHQLLTGANFQLCNHQLMRMTVNAAQHAVAKVAKLDEKAFGGFIWRDISHKSKTVTSLYHQQVKEDDEMTFATAELTVHGGHIFPPVSCIFSAASLQMTEIAFFGVKSATFELGNNMNTTLLFTPKFL
jgi:hypothetical protein